MNAIFTIVAKNYIGLARVLEESARQHTDSSFFVFIADEWENTENIPKDLPTHILIARHTLNIKEHEWEQMAFKYNLVEFCTAIKAFCFEFLFERGYEKIIYFDPDIYVYSSLEPVFDDLQKVSIIVTPHILLPQTPFKGNYPDYLFLLNGTFNLGFIALRKSPVTESFLAWWHDRLIHHSFFDNEIGTATDQKWMNLLPALFHQQDYLISRHKGMNVAPWNFHEREIVVDQNKFYVQLRELEIYDRDELIFVHFSGYNYAEIGEGNYAHKTQFMGQYPDLNLLFKIYGDSLAKSSFHTYRDLMYSYNTFDNGTGILSLHRRFYRRLIEEKQIIEKPFSTGSNSFYDRLREKGLLDQSSVSADKITNKNIKNFSSKFRYVQMFFNFIQMLIGIRRYSMFIRFLRRFFRDENQVFLIDREVGKKLL